MGKLVMSFALATMFAGTAFLFAAPVLVKSDYGNALKRAELCLHSGIGCGR